MVGAFVLIQARPGASSSVGKAVGEIEGVVAAYIVTGPYDVVAHVEAEEMDRLGRLVVGKVQAVEGVTRTITCPIIHV